MKKEKDQKVIDHMIKLGHIAIKSSTGMQESAFTCPNCDNEFVDYWNGNIRTYIQFADKRMNIFFWDLKEANQIFVRWKDLPCQQLKTEKEKLIKQLIRFIAFK